MCMYILLYGYSAIQILTTTVMMILAEAVQSVAEVPPVVGHRQIVGQGGGVVRGRPDGDHRSLDKALDLRPGDEDFGHR